jgi:hypothetical protein
VSFFNAAEPGDRFGSKFQEKTMKTRFLAAVALTLLYVSFGFAQQYPMMDMVANKVIQKYQTSTCEQLWQEKAHKAPPSQQEKNAIQMLKSDPQMRQAFLNKIAAPIVNKMFECGMIP